jgi:hypothetical protein
MEKRGEAIREWAVSGRPTTLQLGQKGYLKAVDRFTIQHTNTEEAFNEFLRECADYGIPRPSSYNAVFHHCYRSPRVRRTYNQYFEYSFYGAWEEAKKVGVLRGRWHKYDLNSAYMWAASLGLPTIGSVRISKHLGKFRGLYNLELEAPLEHLPYPYNSHRFVNATDEEIDLYSLPIKKILGGVTWTDYVEGDPIIKTVKQFTFAKEVSKSFWGRWCSSSPIQCRSISKEWEIRNPILNLIWAHVLIGRVKMRVWSESKNAAHVFVDSIITQDVLPTGDRLGEWKHEKTYDGLRVKHPGFYGPANGDWDRTTGVTRDATLLRA